MKILLRSFDDKYYVWKDAEFKDNYFVVDNTRHTETGILAVKADEGGKLVRCKYCHAIIPNTPEAIEKHFVEKESQRDCLNCMHTRIRNTDNRRRTISKNADGSYSVAETYTATLQCGWSYLDIDTEACNRACMHNQHRLQGVEAIGGVLMQYPDLFEKQITVEALKAKGYEFTRRRNQFFYYDMHLRNTMSAVVNECGIVDHFEASYRYNTCEFYYSATQKKLFYNRGGKYIEGQPNDWSDTRYNSVLHKIEALYKEDKKK